jgi:hypothetical protein
LFYTLSALVILLLRSKRINIDPQAAAKLQSELTSGESIYWAGMPNPKILFHSDDWTQIPFSLLWGGFAIFWEAGVLGFWGNDRTHSAPGFLVLWGIPFVAVGQYLIWGRFVLDAWLKRRTYYCVTDRRVLLLQEGWKRKTQFSFLESIPEISREGELTGTLWLGPKLPVLGGRRSPTRNMSRFSIGAPVPVLTDIDDLDDVYRLILDLRERARLSSH